MMLLIEIQNAKVFCISAGCEQVIDLEGTVNITETCLVTCPSCGAVYYLKIAYQILTDVDVKSNAAALLAAVEYEKFLNCEDVENG
jgi:pseudouridine-5'-phosphate glycosidase